jgi:CheY-like chemotaxis protein
MCALIRAVLEAAGHEVVAAADGRAAWELVERERPALVLLDWQMPELSGIEVCERIRRGSLGRDTFIIMVTTRGATSDLMRMLDAGADDYLWKPLASETLRTRVLIAERRMATDRAKRAAEDALARAQWLAGIGETALAIQHEINNPLTAMLGNVALLQNDLATPEEERHCIAVIAEQGMRIAGVVKRLATLREPRSVEYVRGSRMIDLSGGRGEP